MIMIMISPGEGRMELWYVFYCCVLRLVTTFYVLKIVNSQCIIRKTSIIEEGKNESYFLRVLISINKGAKHACFAPERIQKSVSKSVKSCSRRVDYLRLA